MSALQVLRTKFGGMLLGSGRSSSWALLGQAAMALASLANFLLLARLLGPGSYGTVAGALALVLTVGPISALGADKLVVRDIARRPDSARSALTYALLTVATGAVVTTLALVVLQPILLPQAPVILLIALALAEALSGGVMQCCAGAHFAAGRGRTGGLTMTLISGAKISAVVAFAITNGGDPVRWAVLYAGFAMLAAMIVATWSFRLYGRPVIAGYQPIRRAREGLPYSANVASTIAQNDIDKTLLLRAGYAEGAGLYSVAYRLATMAWLPVLAVLQATQPRFFALGDEGGLSATQRFARQLIRPLAAYGVFAAVVLVAVAPLIPVLVGEEYRGSVTILMLMAPLALFKAAQYVPSEALTGAGKQSTRTACIAVSMGLNLLLGILFIPRYGVAAALVATFLSESLYVVLVRIALRRGAAKEAASSMTTPEAP